MRSGGDAENRTRDGGFADLCLATWLRRRPVNDSSRRSRFHSVGALVAAVAGEGPGRAFPTRTSGERRPGLDCRWRTCRGGERRSDVLQLLALGVDPEEPGDQATRDHHAGTEEVAVGQRRAIGAVTSRYPDAVAISATKRTGFSELLGAVDRSSRGDTVDLEILVPYGSESVLAEIRKIGGVERTEYVDGGTRAWGWVPRHAARRFETYAAAPSSGRA